MLTTLHNQSGLTLLELLIVVFILSAIALTTVSFSNTADSQFRFDDTKTRLTQIRRAIIGQPTQTLNGEPAISGFVADIGRLPSCMAELLGRVNLRPEPPCNEIPCPCSDNTLPEWGFDSTLGLWAGWNGPYLAVLPEQGNGNRIFRDGWGNGPVPPPDQPIPPDQNNFGWAVVTPASNTLAVQSLGSDGLPGASDPTSPYDDDYPPAGNLVEPVDHQVNLNGIIVTFINPGDGAGEALPAIDEEVRIFVCYPNPAQAEPTDLDYLQWCANSPTDPPWPPSLTERNNAGYLSLVQTLDANSVPDGGQVDTTFQFNGGDKFVPWGVRAINVVTDAEGTSFGVNGLRHITLVPRTPVKLTVHLDSGIGIEEE